MEHINNQAAIGVFDSGVGGLTVMQQMMHVLPCERFIYFGDTARVPYGEKSPETIIRYSIENSIFLMEHKIKLLVVACNTASAYSLEKLRTLFHIPIVGVVEPGVSAVLAKTKNKRIAILGTKGTIKSDVYQVAIKERDPDAHVISIACPLFVPLVEERLVDHLATRLLIKEYLAPLKEEQVDTVLLACTHYPLLRTLIQEELGPDVNVVDSATTCAEQVAALLQAQEGSGQHVIENAATFFVSDDPEKFRLIGKDFLGMHIPHVQLILPKN